MAVATATAPGRRGPPALRDARPRRPAAQPLRRPARRRLRAARAGRAQRPRDRQPAGRAGSRWSRLTLPPGGGPVELGGGTGGGRGARLRGRLPACAPTPAPAPRGPRRRRSSASPCSGRDGQAKLSGREIPLRPRHAEILTLLCANPDGLTSEELAEGVYGDSTRGGGIRVEISRLRKLLGDVHRDRALPAARRACSPTWPQVCGLLHRGRVREAAARYPGPLLPRSRAPGRGPRARGAGGLDAPVGDERGRPGRAVGVAADHLAAPPTSPPGSGCSPTSRSPIPAAASRPRGSRSCAPTRTTATHRARPACNACVTPTRPGVGYCRLGRGADRRTGGRRPRGEEPDPCRVIQHASSRTRPSLRPAAASAPRDRCCASSRCCSSTPTGVRADEVAKALGKSVSTAYYLLTSLCEEGFAVHESKGVYRRARGLEELTAGVGEHTHPARAARGPGRQRRRAVPAHPQALLPRRGQGRPDRDRRLLRPPGGAADARPGLGDPRQRPRPGDGQGRAVAAGAQRAGALRGPRADRRSRPTRSSRPSSSPPSSNRSGATATPSTARSSTRTSAASRRRSSTPAAGSWRRSGCR